jgi:hypothetical protein
LPANLSNSSTRQKFASFVEFEYSPKWPFWKIGQTRYIRPTFANHFPRTRYIRPTFANHFAQTRQTCKRQVWQLLHEFSEFSEFGEFSECRLDPFIHKNIFFCIFNNLSCLRRHWPPYFARTRYIRPTFANHFPRTRYIRSRSTFAIFEKNVTRLDTFVRVIRHFGKFGASGHCLIIIQGYALGI